jgi:glutamate/tyrosine decarboxylase-like PLP-dependent enzyme
MHPEHAPDLDTEGAASATENPVPAVLKTAAQAADEYLADMPFRRVSPDSDALAAIAGFDVELPDGPRSPVDVVAQLHRLGSPATTASAGGRFFGLVVGATLPAALGARILTSAWDQVVFNDQTSPIGCALERITAGWIIDVLRLPREAHVTYVTGATMGNFTALASARDALLRRAGHDALDAGLWGAPRLRVVTGDEVHVTVVKALTLLGFGRAEIERVPTDDQGRIRPDALPDLDERTILILQAGNVTSGAIDPFGQVIPRARRAGAWVHVDGAFGLWAAASPALRPMIVGIEDADSWVTDGHKWLNTPYDCGLAIVRDAHVLHQVMATQAPYLAAGTAVAPKDMGPEFSRSARAVEVWAALYSLGRQGLADLIERTCGHARVFAEGLRALGYTVLNDVTLNQVVAAPPGDPDAAGRIATRVQDSGECWFGPTVWRGRPAIRISVSSHATSTDDVRRSLDAIAAATEADRPKPSSPAVPPSAPHTQ